VSTRTSRPKTSSERPRGLIRSVRGFTITELLIVVALITMIMFLAIPSLTGQTRLALNASARELATVIKESYNSAVMTGRVHRVVYDLAARQYWVESGPNTVLLDTAESKEKEERRRRLFDKKEAPAAFALDRTVTSRKKSLPTGVEFEDVFTEASGEPVTEGKAYTHMFPHGITEQTIIHLKNSSKQQISLVVSALVGRTRMLDGHATREEAYGK
jgi:Tfp pilus assembly protein FimT